MFCQENGTYSTLQNLLEQMLCNKTLGFTFFQILSKKYSSNKLGFSKSPENYFLLYYPKPMNRY